MDTSPTNTSINEQELCDYINRTVGISRTRLNVQAFIGLFVFGWLMKMNYDDLKQGGVGWAFLIVMAIIFAIGRQVEPYAFILMPVIYLGAWVHINIIFSRREKAATEKFLTAKNTKAGSLKAVIDSSDNDDSAIKPTEVVPELSDEALQVIELSEEPQLARFLAYTHEAWMRGTLEFFSDNFEKVASSVGAHEFINSFNPFLNLLAASNNARNFQDGEYMVGYTDRTFLMTNQVIYFFPDRDLASSPIIVKLPTIQSYKLKSNWISCSIEIEQLGGNTISISKIKGGPDENIVRHFSQKNSD